MPLVQMCRIKKSNSKFVKGQMVFVHYICGNGTIIAFGRYLNKGRYILQFVNNEFHGKIFRSEVNQEFAFFLYRASKKRYWPDGMRLPKWKKGY